jgi:hypothetical protein
MRRGIRDVAKKVFPLSIDLKERRVLEHLSERDGVSMAESMRRLIRSAPLDAPAPAPRPPGESAHDAPRSDRQATDSAR